MITSIVFFFMIVAGSIYGAARFGKRFEEVIPISVMGMIILLFLFGLAGQLQIGIIAVCVAVIVLYVLTIRKLIITRNVQGFLCNLFTPASVVFAVLYVGFSIWNYGKMANGWDEFTHWVDVVKAVTMIDDFATNPAANSYFQSYPPGMMLFQYSLQKVNQWINPNAVFCEWQVYFCYQLFILIIMMPFFRSITFKQPVRLVLYGAISLLAPLLFYRNLYNSVYIDPVIGILFGTGMSMVALRPEQDDISMVYICLLCAVLTLSKDVGIAFSLSIALAFGIISVKEKKERREKECLTKVAVVFISAYLPKLLWDWEVHTAKAKVSFNSKIDWDILIHTVLGQEDTYRRQVMRLYTSALSNQTVQLGHLPAFISYTTLLVLFSAALYGIYRIYIYIRIFSQKTSRTVPQYGGGCCYFVTDFVWICYRAVCGLYV